MQEQAGMQEQEGLSTPKLLQWEQRPEETSKAYAAFSAYLSLGTERSLAKTLQNPLQSLQNPLGIPGARSLHTLKEWCLKHEWVQRARAYDQHRADAARKAAEDDHAQKIAAYRERAGKIAAATADVSLGFLRAAGLRLKNLTDGSGKESIADIPLTGLPSLLRAAAAVAQISLAVEAESLGVRELESLLASDKDPEKDPA